MPKLYKFLTSLTPSVYWVVIALSLFALPQFSRVLAATSQPAGGLKITLKDVNAGGSKINGALEIENNTDGNFADVFYTALLYSQNPPEQIGEGVNSHQIIGGKDLVNYYRSDNFTIKEGEKRSFSFAVEYSPNINSGNYTLFAEVTDSQSNAIAYGSADLSLEGTGRFLNTDISSCYILIDSFKYVSTEGPNIDPGINPEGYCTVTNPTSSSLTLSYRTAYSVDSVINNLDDLKQENSTENITIAPGETKDVKIVLPALEKPQVYSALVTLLDQDGNAVTSVLPFRWIVKGRSAIISTLSLDKSYYKSGEQAQVNFSGGPSLDLNWRGVSKELYPKINDLEGTNLSDPVLQVQIKNNTGLLCGEKNYPLPKDTISWNDIKIDIPIDKTCENPVVLGNIKDGDEVLVAGQKEYISSNKDKAGPEQSKDGSRNLLAGVLFTVLIIGLISALVFFLIKKKKNQPPPHTTSPPGPVQVTVMVFFIAAVILSLFLAKHEDWRDGLLKIPAVLAKVQNNRIDLPVDPFVTGAITKQPINNSSATVQNIIMKREWHGNASAFANFHDFSQNNPSGDSSVEVSPDCSKIKVRVEGSSGFTAQCTNWGHGIAVLNYLDNNPANPLGLKSPRKNTIITNIHQKQNGFIVYTPPIKGNAPPDLKNAEYELNTGLSSTDTAEHTLKVLVGATEIQQGLTRSDTSFNTQVEAGETNCGSPNKPCYGVLEYKFSCGPPACNSSCTSDTFCADAQDGCTSCLPNDTGTGNVCRPTPACNVACTRDGQCAGARDGCTACVNNSCQKVPVCGDTCTTPADCQNARDGCTQCLPNPSGGGNICQPPPPPACGAFCERNDQCAGNREGCIQCVAGQCRVPPACNVTCTRNDQCAGARDGCVECLPADNGVGSVCKVPPACNVTCTRNDQCAGARDGCTSCLPNDTGIGNVCRETPACNVACTRDGQCAGARDGCTACVGGVCRVPPACNVACTRDGQCAGARNGCTACVGGVCKIPPACNVSCTTSSDCARATDGCTSCLPNDTGTGNVCRETPACNVACTRNDQCAGARDGCTACVGGVCRVPPACNVACTRDGQCAGARDGCTACVGGVCKIPPACNVSCTTSSDCARATDGCTSCLPNDTGTGNVCRETPACNVACTRNDQCAGARDGCTSCLPNDTGTGNVCRETPACNVACTRNDQCAGARDGCTACVGGVCKIPPACGVACQRDGDCAGARDGCIACVSGVCKIPPKCGTACTTRAECSGAKDGCNECLEGTCTDFNAKMCKCDGMEADLTFPTNKFTFTAFGKVEGADVKKAEIRDVIFRITETKQGQRQEDARTVRGPDLVKPTIIESSANKVRIKATWSTPPPPVTLGSTYRAFADITAGCKPKKIIASTEDSFTPNPDILADVRNGQIQLKPPPALKLIADTINKFGGNSNDQVKAFTSKLLSMFGASTVHAQTSNLQLRTLNFVKILGVTCNFIMFKYDETLF